MYSRRFLALRPMELSTITVDYILQVMNMYSLYCIRGLSELPSTSANGCYFHILKGQSSEIIIPFLTYMDRPWPD
jgi:hypothetical protein